MFRLGFLRRVQFVTAVLTSPAERLYIGMGRADILCPSCEGSVPFVHM